MLAPDNHLVVCPSCGDYVRRLTKAYGWCFSCSSMEANITNAADRESQIEAFFKQYADNLEYHILNGNSLRDSVKLLKLERRILCQSCGAVMRGAPKNAIFCRKTAQCRKFSRRYVYYYDQKGLSKAEALAKVLEGL